MIRSDLPLSVGGKPDVWPALLWSSMEEPPCHGCAADGNMPVLPPNTRTTMATEEKSTEMAASTKAPGISAAQEEGCPSPVPDSGGALVPQGSTAHLPERFQNPGCDSIRYSAVYSLSFEVHWVVIVCVCVGGGLMEGKVPISPLK